MALADEKRKYSRERQFAFVGYEIALHFVPPHNFLLMSDLLSKMLLLCHEMGPSFAKKATTFLKKAQEIQTHPSQVNVSLPSATVGIMQLEYCFLFKVFYKCNHVII